MLDELNVENRGPKFVEKYNIELFKKHYTKSDEVHTNALACCYTRNLGNYI